ncbi:MAG: response regulator [Leptospiraceae bacterium]|nr:response regulator [Leptospiraceae bacterium]
MYSEEILTIWQDDKSPENPLIDPMGRKLFKQFLTQSLSEVQSILKIVTSLEISKNKQQDLDQIYRKNHNILGFSKILKIQKLTHLTSLLDFIFDFARKENSVSKYSVDYLIKLILNSEMKVLNQLNDTGFIKEDISLLIEEAKVYLSKPLEIWNERHRQTQANFAKKAYTIPSSQPSIKEEIAHIVDNPPVSSQPQKETQINNSMLQIPEAEKINDEPEELNIPIEKISLISDFYEESYENLSKIANRLVDLESNTDSLEIINELFRSVHTVKGGARLLKIIKIEKLSHSVENLLDLLRNQKLQVTAVHIDYLLEARSAISEMIEEVASKGPIRIRIAPLVTKLNLACGIGTLESTNSNLNTVSNENTEPVKKEETEIKLKQDLPLEVSKQEQIIVKEKEPVVRMKERQVESIRVSIDKLDEVINTASELSISRIQFQEQIANISRMSRDIKRSLVNAEELDSKKLLERISKSNQILISELKLQIEKNGSNLPESVLFDMVYRFHNEIKAEISRNELSQHEELTLLLISFQELKNSMMKNVENLETLTSKLQNEVMNFRMVPISTLFERFPSLVRDMARQAGKKLKIVLYGQETELDRVMINTLLDPLLHILRNSIDHGLEEPPERIQNGKNETGTINLSAYYQGSYAVIEIKDDGRGIDIDAVLKRAIERGLVTEDRVSFLSQKEIIEFIFSPGFSTAEKLTEMSGRGVGMDVVMSTIKSLQGSIDVQTKKGQGTTLFLKIPLTLAVVRVLLFETGSQLLAFPMTNVDEILTVSREEIETVGSKFLYHLRSEVISLVPISELLNIPHPAFIKEEIPVIILSDGTQKVGLIVDSLWGRQEIVIKNLGNLLKKVPFIMGCTILSDRRLVLILNPRELIEVATIEKDKLELKLPAFKMLKKENPISILVVDDSPMQRKSIKSILTRAGYLVDEAENGFEAMKLVRIKKYSLFCIDLVMPLMDGFDLVSRLKSLPLYKSIPVIVITSKNSTEDKERGLKIGANEFLEKPVDPDTLTDLVKRYIGVE